MTFYAKLNVFGFKLIHKNEIKPLITFVCHIAVNHSGNQTIPLVGYMHLITHNPWPPARHSETF